MAQQQSFKVVVLDAAGNLLLYAFRTRRQAQEMYGSLLRERPDCEIKLISPDGVVLGSAGPTKHPP